MSRRFSPPIPTFPRRGGKGHHTLAQRAFALNLVPLPIKGEGPDTSPCQLSPWEGHRLRGSMAKQ